MAEVRKVRRKKREQRLGFNWFFWISFIVICVPCAYFVYLLMQASKVSNTPITGSRLQDTIATQITQEQLATVSANMNGLENVESSETNLKVQTLRITINATDGLEEDVYKEMALAAYESVVETLPLETYFTRTDSIKQYDLEITVYDNLNSEEPIIVSVTKNAAMEEYTLQVLNEPVNAQLAEELTQDDEEDLETPEEDGEAEGSDASGE